MCICIYLFAFTFVYVYIYSIYIYIYICVRVCVCFFVRGSSELRKNSIPSNFIGWFKRDSQNLYCFL